MARFITLYFFLATSIFVEGKAAVLDVDEIISKILEISKNILSLEGQFLQGELMQNELVGKISRRLKDDKSLNQECIEILSIYVDNSNKLQEKITPMFDEIFNVATETQNWAKAVQDLPESLRKHHGITILEDARRKLDEIKLYSDIKLKKAIEFGKVGLDLLTFRDKIFLRLHCYDDLFN